MPICPPTGRRSSDRSLRFPLNQLLPALVVALVLLPGSVAAGDPSGLIEQLRSGEPSARAEAVAGLVRMGPAAIAPLFARLGQVPGADDVPVQLAASRVVQAAAAPGAGAVREATAAALVREARSNPSPAARRYALEQLSYVAGPESVQPLAGLLKDPEVAEMARWALARVPGEGATRALVAAAAETRGDLLLGVVAALGERQAEAAVPVLSRLARSRDEALRIAARDAVGRIPTAAGEPLLREGLESESPREQALAASAYLNLAASLASTSDGRNPARRMYRWAAEHAHDPAARLGAIAGLSATEDEDAAGVLLAALSAPDRAVRDAAVQALTSIPGLTPPLLRVLGREKQDPQTRRAVIRVLGRRGDARAVPPLMRSLEDRDPEIVLAAMAALGELGDPRAADALLALAAENSGPVRSGALRAYLALGARMPERGEALAVYSNGLRLASSEDERRVVFRHLRTLGSPDAVPLVEPYLSRPGPLRNDAAAVALSCAAALVGSNRPDMALALLRRALPAAADPVLRRRMAETMRDLGAPLDVAAELGYLTRWWALGPLPGRERWTRQDAFDPRVPVEPIRRVAVDGQPLSWRVVSTADADGMLDLERAVAQQEDAVAYLYAEFRSPRTQEVEFRVGSDDGFILWVNGTRVGESLAGRPYAADQSVVRVRLEPGPNSVLLKATQSTGQWAVGVRVCLPTGEPVRLDVLTPEPGGRP